MRNELNRSVRWLAMALMLATLTFGRSADATPIELNGASPVDMLTSSLPVVSYVAPLQPDWRTGLLMLLSHPIIAYGLLLIGIYGLLLEGYHPGAVLPGVVGALSLILALYAFELLAVNFAGLALIVLGAGLITMEFFMPAFGSLGVGGLAAFVIGSIILFDNHAQGPQVALSVIGGIATAGALVIATIAWLAARARRRPVTTGAEAMIGGLVEVIADGSDHCVVRYGGEIWNARAAGSLHAGQQARIVKVVGLTLWIEP